MLDQAQVSAIAKDLFDQHERREIYKGFADKVPTMEDATTIQEAYVALLRKKLKTETAGFKVALTSKQTRDWLGINEPCPGQVLANRIHRSPYTVKVSDYVRFSMETEVCLVLDKDMSGPCSITDVKRNLRSIHCAYELVEDRGADLTKLDAKSLVSDNSWNAGIVMGPPAPSLDIDLSGRKGRFVVNGKLSKEGTTSETMGGNPLHVMAWLIEYLGRTGRTLKAGFPVITGSLIATQFPVAGDHLVFEVDGIPPVEMKLVP
jgi:2-keto-4-pentenoate hydratase